MPKTKAALAEVLVKAAPDLADINDVAAELAADAAANLLADLSDDKKKIVRRLVTRALDNGWSDDELASRIAEKVGLDQRYALAVENFRNREGAKNQPKMKVHREAQAYARRLRKHRALVIARTEVQRLLNEAQRLIWTQQQEDGDLSPYAVRVTRIHRDERLCRVCQGQNGKRRSLKRAKRGDGPPFHPNCRCYEELEDLGVAKMEDIEKAITPGGRVGDDSSLDRSPKKNWVESAGGLPKYIRMVAHALIRAGKPRSRAIAMAVGIVRNWAEGKGNVTPKVRAAAAKAIAEWEAKKAKAHVSKADETAFSMDSYFEIRDQLQRDGLI